jgi:uncharacterized protein (DUF1778 family)
MTRKYEEIARDYEARLKRGEELEDLVPVKALLKASPRAVFSLRLAPAELSAISTAAKRQGLNLSDFIRMAALAAAQGDLDLDVGQKATTLEEVREHVRALAESVKRL